MPPKQRPNTFVFEEGYLNSSQHPFEPEVSNDQEVESLRIALAAARIVRDKHQRAYEASQREVGRLRLALAKAEKVAREQEY